MKIIKIPCTKGVSQSGYIGYEVTNEQYEKIKDLSLIKQRFICSFAKQMSGNGINYDNLHQHRQKLDKQT